MTTTLNRLDLNLLRVFDAVMEERSVLRAGQRICLSQSAVSHALARLREVLGDELFIRTPSGMQPTARALTMAPLVREAWQSLETAVGAPKFEPGKAARRFTIAVSDLAATVMIPRLLDVIRQEAPLMEIAVRADSASNLAEQIDLGQIDAAVGTFSHKAARFRSRVLFDSDDVLIAGSNHRRGPWSLKSLSQLSIVAISLNGENDDLLEGPVSERGLSRRSEMYDRAALEGELAALGHSGRIVVLPHFLALSALLGQPGLVAIVPRFLAVSMALTQPLEIHELPYTSSSIEVTALWHERTTNDAAQQWLLGMLSRATEHLRGPASACPDSASTLTSPKSKDKTPALCRM